MAGRLLLTLDRRERGPLQVTVSYFMQTGTGARDGVQEVLQASSYGKAGMPYQRSTHSGEAICDMQGTFAVWRKRGYHDIRCH